MTGTEFVWIAVGMGLITVTLRALPSVIAGRVTPSKRVMRFLHNVPYAVIGALIFPGVLSATESPWIGLAGIAVAGLSAWLRLPAVVALVAAILATYALLLVA